MFTLKFIKNPLPQGQIPLGTYLIRKNLLSKGFKLFFLNEYHETGWSYISLRSMIADIKVHFINRHNDLMNRIYDV